MASTIQETLGPPHQWTATDHIRAPPSCLCTADLPWRVEVVVRGHSQSLQLTGLGKSLSLTCQQQPRPSYKRRVYSDHMKGAAGVPSLVRGEAVPLDLTGHLLYKATLTR